MNIMQHPSVITQVGHLKLSFPRLLVGSEPSGQCAYVYHTCKAVLEYPQLSIIGPSGPYFLENWTLMSIQKPKLQLMHPFECTQKVAH